MLIMMMKMTKNLLQITYSVKRIMTQAFFGLYVSNGAGGRAKIHLFKILLKHQTFNLWFITNSTAKVAGYKRAF